MNIETHPICLIRTVCMWFDKIWLTQLSFKFWFKSWLVHRNLTSPFSYWVWSMSHQWDKFSRWNNQNCSNLGRKLCVRVGPHHPLILTSLLRSGLARQPWTCRFLICLNCQWIVYHPVQHAALQETFSLGLMKNECKLINRSSLTHWDGWHQQSWQRHNWCCRELH